MRVLVLGGTRFFGKYIVRYLLNDGHDVTIATRGLTKDDFSDNVKRIILDRTDENSIKEALKDKTFDVICDNIAFCSNDVKCLLDNINFSKYILTSTTAVYNKHINTIEEEYEPLQNNLVWCSRMDYHYAEVKRQAENALYQQYLSKNFIAVRYPFVIGKDDYTNRLKFYVENIINEVPMNIDNYSAQMSFISSDEAGKFIAFLVDSEYKGAVNGACSGTISIKDVANYVESKTGKKIIISTDGISAPYNGENEYTINTSKAEHIGFKFSNLNDWVYDLIDYYIECN